MPFCSCRFANLVLALLAVAVPSLADVHVAILPSPLIVQPGEVFDVEVTITEPGAPFNGYDAIVGYDPAVLTFLQRSQAEQEGSLMTQACANRFHVFNANPAQGELSISHVLLCAGVSVTGEGVVYRLRFQAGAQAEGTTTLALLEGTAFYLAGNYVTPVFMENATIQIGGSTSAPTPAAGRLALRAAPNPFNPRTTLAFVADAPAAARLALYDARGQLVRVLLDEVVSAGARSVTWDGTDTTGRPVAAGVYLARLEVGGQRVVSRVTLVE
jgi:hypothetical protein